MPSIFFPGECLSTNRCAELDGRPEGSCAQGFGVCCTFIIETDDGAAVARNKVTYLRNPSFPQPDTATRQQTVQLIPRDGDTTQFLLEFLMFDVQYFDIKFLSHKAIVFEHFGLVCLFIQRSYLIGTSR